MINPRSGRVARGLGWIGVAIAAAGFATPAAAQNRSDKSPVVFLESTARTKGVPTELAITHATDRALDPIVFDSGTPLPDGGANFSSFPMADDFTLDAETTLSGLRFWTADPNSSPWDGSGGTYRIYSDVSGPAALLAVGSMIPVSTTVTAPLGTYTQHERVISFDSPVVLGAGTYWLHLTEGCSGTTRFWSNSSQAVGQPLSVRFTFGVCDLVPNASLPVYVAFQLLGEAPCKPDVLIVYSDTCPEDVEAMLEGTGRFGAVDAVSGTNSTPSLSQLQQYDVVLFYSNIGWNNQAAMGDVAADYFDSGGGVVNAVFSNTGTDNSEMLGRWLSGGYNCLVPAGHGLCVTRTLGTVYLPSHPLMNGVSTLDMRCGSDQNALTPGSVRIADLSDGSVLAATKNIGGRDVYDLGLFPVTFDCSNGYDESTDGDTLIANALVLAANCGDEEVDPCDDDTTAPIILDCPSDFETSCNTEGGYNFDYDPDVEEECSYTVEKSWENPLPFGENELTVTVTDGNENTDSCTFYVTVVPDAKDPIRVFSTPGQDGWVRETDYVHMIEGPTNSKATTFDVGDDAQNWGKRGILSFNTSGIPGDAVITSARIRLTRSSLTNNVNALGSLHLDMPGEGSISRCAGCCSSYINGSAVESADYDTTEGMLMGIESSFPAPGGNGFTTFAEISPEGFDWIDRSCTTQFRVRFDQDSDNDNGADVIVFHAGEAGATTRPELIVEYYLPSCSPCEPAETCGGATIVATLYSTAAEDGGLQESHYTSEVGGTASATASSSPVGDTAQRQGLQFLANFDTSSIPAGAEITSAELRIYRSSATGTWAAFGPIQIGMRPPCSMPWNFGANGTLEIGDYQAVAPILGGQITVPASNTYAATLLNAAGIAAINKGGTTQVKLGFATSDDGDVQSDQVQIATGNYGSTSPGRPRLVITYVEACEVH